MKQSLLVWPLALGIACAAQDRSEQPADFDPLAPPSIILFEEGPRQLSAEEVAKRVGKLFGKELKVLDAADEEASNYVVGFGDRVLLDLGGDLFGITFRAKSHVDADGMASGVREARMRHAVRIHRSLVDVRALKESADREAAAEAHRRVAMVTAALLDIDQSLVVSLSQSLRMFLVDSTTYEALCGKDPLESLKSAGENPPVILVPDDDPEIVAAQETAQERWGEFVEAFKADGKKEGATFAVKVPVTEGKVTEHLWISVKSISRGRRVKGVIDNDPVNLKKHELGDQISVSAKKVGDWIMMRGDKMVGGFSIAAVSRSAERIAGEERAAKKAERAKEGQPASGRKR